MSTGPVAVLFCGLSLNTLTDRRSMLEGNISTCEMPPVTVTAKKQVAFTPAGLTAAQLTVVVPTGNTEPDSGAHATVVPAGPDIDGSG
jgi:hypothetical protein